MQKWKDSLTGVALVALLGMGGRDLYYDNQVPQHTHPEAQHTHPEMGDRYRGKDADRDFRLRDNEIAHINKALSEMREMVIELRELIRELTADMQLLDSAHPPIKEVLEPINKLEQRMLRVEILLNEDSED